MAQEKQNIQIPDLKGKNIEEFLKEIEANCMIDDHGDALIGDRKKKTIAFVTQESVIE